MPPKKKSFTLGKFTFTTYRIYPTVLKPDLSYPVTTFRMSHHSISLLK